MSDTEISKIKVKDIKTKQDLVNFVDSLIKTDSSLYDTVKLDFVLIDRNWYLRIESESS